MNCKTVMVGPFELLDDEGNLLEICDTYEEAYSEVCLVLGSKPISINRVTVANIVTANFGINPDTNKPIYVRYRLERRSI